MERIAHRDKVGFIPNMQGCGSTFENYELNFIKSYTAI